MFYDYYTSISSKGTHNLDNSLSNLISGQVDILTWWFWFNHLELEKNKGSNQNTRQFQQEKNKARSSFTKQATALNLELPEELRLNWAMSNPNWLALQVDFVLLTPWYSKDDRPFHVLDNPVHKDRVFGIPFMAASNWKGLLRWACRMQAGMGKYLESHEGRIEGWRDPEWILHLFGNEKGERENFQQGALVFYPTWFNKIGFEVINPHSRELRAGTQPIYYEVVPPGAGGVLSLLYAPLPGSQDAISLRDVLPELLTAIEALLTTYGFSAKRTAGWGTAKIQAWKAPNFSIEECSKKEFERKLLNGGAK